MLQDDLVTTEEPGYRIQEIPRSLAAPPPSGRRILRSVFYGHAQQELHCRQNNSNAIKSNELCMFKSVLEIAQKMAIIDKKR